MSITLESDNSTWSSGLLSNDILICNYSHLLVNFDSLPIGSEAGLFDEFG